MREDGMYSWGNRWFRWSVVSLVVFTVAAVLVGFVLLPSVHGDFTAQGLHEANEQLDVMNLDDKERQSYSRYLKDLRDVASANFTLEIQAKPLIEKAHEKGKEEGIQEGIQEGKREGVLNLHADGFDIPKISKWMNLTEEEVHQIIENR